MAMDFTQLKALESLMSSAMEGDDSSSHFIPEPSSSSSKLTPASFGPKSSSAKSASGVNPNHKTEVIVRKVDPKAIWEESEVNESENSKFEDESDDRITPEFEILYKQNVRPEDMFLGMDPSQGPSTLSCSEMVVKVTLPGAQMKDLMLDVTQSRFLVRSAKYKLSTHLPYPVDEKRAAAKWDSCKSILSVMLPIVRQNLWDRVDE